MRRGVFFLILGGLILFCANLSFSATINIPDDYSTIQGGINAAVGGDTVLVASGTYTENLDFLGKSIVVVSSEGAEHTTIDPDTGASAVQFISGESADAILSGFTAYPGSGPSVILIENGSTPIIRRNIFHNCETAVLIRSYNSNPTIKLNLFYYNNCTACIGIHSGAANIINNTFDENEGGGFFTNDTGIAVNNIVTNSSYGIGGSGTFTNLNYNNIWNNTWNYAGNSSAGINDIAVDPLYNYTPGNDYSLSEFSPCIDAGDPDPQYNDPDDTRNDMGAFFYNQSQGPKWYVSTTGNDIFGDGSETYPFATIQHAIDLSDDGDTVIVMDGTYTGDGNRDIDFSGKAIVVKSENGPEYTIIDCEGTESDLHRAFVFHNYEDSNSIIAGFQLTGGYAPDEDDIKAKSGGSIICISSSPIISNCNFYYNISDLGGGAITLKQVSSPYINKCVFYGNQAIYGGAIRVVQEAQPIIDSCLFVKNHATNFGGAIRYDTYEKYTNIKNCTFYDNSALIGSAIDFAGITIATMDNNIFAYNIQGSAISFTPPENPHNPILNCIDIYGNEGGNWNENIFPQFGINGNISLDPLFCDTAYSEFTIRNSSPCAPENNDCGKLIGAFGIGCDNMISDYGFKDESLPNVISHTPEIFWAYVDTLPEDSFEIAVGIDDDWTYAEMWNPAPSIGPDTSIAYSGASLIDGETYYMRLRVHNSVEWSIWYDTSFRMNSMPSIPVQIWPINDEVAGNTPILWIENSTDAEGDVVTYEFSGFHDTDCVAPNIDLQGVVEGTDSTGGQIIDPLGENCIYWWSARAFDGYEYSDWSTTQRFYIDGTPEPPTAFQIQYPPDTSGWYVFDMLSNFFWEPSDEPDPLDSVYYTLSLSLDSNFAFVNHVDSLWQPWFTAIDSLEFATQYWWKVKATDNTGLFTYSSNTLTFKTWKLGDANGDWQVNIFDITFIITYLYLDGPAPGQLIMGDVNGDCVINIFDITYLIAHLYLDGPAPQVGCE